MRFLWCEFLDVRTLKSRRASTENPVAANLSSHLSAAEVQTGRKASLAGAMGDSVTGLSPDRGAPGRRSYTRGSGQLHPCWPLGVSIARRTPTVLSCLWKTTIRQMRVI